MVRFHLLAPKLAIYTYARHSGLKIKRIPTTHTHWPTIAHARCRCTRMTKVLYQIDGEKREKKKLVFCVIRAVCFLYVSCGYRSEQHYKKRSHRYVSAPRYGFPCVIALTIIIKLVAHQFSLRSRVWIGAPVFYVLYRRSIFYNFSPSYYSIALSDDDAAQCV